MIWEQTTIQLDARPRGFHLVTRDVVAGVTGLARVGTGMLHLMLQHTSASLSINENASPDVRRDLAEALRRLVPDGAPYFRHVEEGPDDMSAHVKSALLGCELTIPVSDGALVLGTWQGLYLGEHRDAGGPRRIVATLTGRPR